MSLSRVANANSSAVKSSGAFQFVVPTESAAVVVPGLVIAILETPKSASMAR
jgi:hypothetical protein